MVSSVMYTAYSHYKNNHLDLCFVDVLECVSVCVCLCLSVSVCVCVCVREVVGVHCFRYCSIQAH